MKRSALAALVSVLMVTSACSNLSEREQRTLSGGALGAAGGAILGVIGGGVVLGAVAGAAAGAAIGAVTNKDQVGIEGGDPSKPDAAQ